MKPQITCILLVLTAALVASAAEKYDTSNARYEQIRKEHWAFQPVRDVPPPGVKLGNWATTDIDRYILAGLEKEKLTPSKNADRRTLIRRVTFDLTGLPPTPEEIEAFVNDNTTGAFESVVDRLLASSAYGERWGRHWLDVARYAESSGMTRNAPYYYAWRYRDYVIQSINSDKPYNQFIKEQVAGDLLPAQTDAQRDAQTIATGFLTLGPKDLNERDPLQYNLNQVDEQIDTTTRAFMGLTVACARCHDHKFDPIPTAEYYSMAGIFRSTETLSGVTARKGPRVFFDPNLLAPLPSSRNTVTEKPANTVSAAYVRPIVDKLTRKQAKKDRKSVEQDRQRQLFQEMREAMSRNEPEIRPIAMAVKDGRIPFDSNIYVRGDKADKGPVVPRGTITLPGTQPLKIAEGHSGRLELANWIASESNPLTARVMVNRIWLHLFGQGLVRTVDNFGTTGEAPTHPQLLDHLAKQFMNDGWSVKRAIKRIVMSTSYQQAGTFDEANFAVDPDNKLVWRMSPRRLEGEAIRDAMLATAGVIDRKHPVGSPLMDAPPVDLARGNKFASRFSGPDHVRSVYLPIVRGSAPASLDVFDLADNSMVTGCRDVTTVAPQALFMMNDSFVLEQSAALAKRICTEKTADEARIDRAYSLTVGRMPTDAEKTRALQYLKSFVSEAPSKSRKATTTTDNDAWASVCQALFASAEFRYVN
jgi:hypothetical protein